MCHSCDSGLLSLSCRAVCTILLLSSSSSIHRSFQRHSAPLQQLSMAWALPSMAFQQLRGPCSKNPADHPVAVKMAPRTFATEVKMAIYRRYGFTHSDGHHNPSVRHGAGMMKTLLTSVRHQATVYKRMKVPMLWMPMPACPHLTTPSWLVLFETVGLAGCLADHLHTFEKQL